LSRDINNFFKYFIYSNLYVSIAAVALTLETNFLLGIPLRIEGSLFLVFFATLFIYNFSRVPIESNQKFIHSLKAFQYTKTTLFSFAGLVISLGFIKVPVLYVLVPLGLISLNYAIPLFKRKNNLFRLREVPLLKIFLISIVWGCTTVVVPVLDKGQNVASVVVIFMLLRRMLFIFAITIPFDIRDTATDQLNNLQTIPGRLGEQKAKILAISALVIFVLFLFIGFNPETGSLEMILQKSFYPLLLSACMAAIFILKTSKKKSNLYYLIFLDGTMIAQFILVYFWPV
jgi:4-hydroxybenzoate polyprenyltransferase